MAWLWARINVRARSKHEKGGEKLGYLMGGFHLIVDGLVKKIKENGGVIKTNCEVNRIKRRNGKVEIGWGKKKMSFDKVVACIPAGVFSKITGVDDKKWKQISYLGFINVVFSSKQSLSHHYWNNIGDSKSPFLVFIQHTNLIDKKNYNNRHLYYLGTYVPQNHKYLSKKEGEVYEEFFAYLKKIFPMFKKELVEEKRIFKFNWAQHVADVNYGEKIPGYKSKIDGVYFANFCQISLQHCPQNDPKFDVQKIDRNICIN